MDARSLWIDTNLHTICSMHPDSSTRTPILGRHRTRHMQRSKQRKHRSAKKETHIRTPSLLGMPTSRRLRPKQNIADVLTLGGYFNPDGVVDASKLLPAGSTRQQYPGLAIATRATKISPVVIASQTSLSTQAAQDQTQPARFWQTPGGGDCTLCDSNPYWQPCTEYRCKNIEPTANGAN